ncbi:MAG: stage III sporulation protein AA [Clostridium sp.]|nr:stage III sporulation protein AA [Clostridium sp.]
MRKMKEDLLQLFPEKKRAFWKKAASQQDLIEEIRLRAGKPICIRKGGREWYLDAQGNFLEGQFGACCINEEEMEAMLQHICHYSLYAFEDELKQGFITVAGGHRIGLAGQAVLNDDGSVRTMKHIYYMNIRVSHQIKGAADGIMPCLYQGNTIKNTLIISPPGCGKTTLLRDMVRQISDGGREHPGLCVGLVDERSEIAGSYLGHPQNDVGMRTDVLDACPKVKGMLMLLRSMAPQVIAVDELGGEEDMRALHVAASCGSKMLATVHGENMEDAAGRLGREEFTGNGLFDLFLVLSRKNGQPTISDILKREEIHASYSGRNHDSFGLLRNRSLV